jgi:RimJ/RimL family protein N-acetyltransferase
MSRVAEVVARHGVGGTGRLLAAKAVEQAYLREEHVWYELDLGSERPRPALAPGLRLEKRPAAADAETWHVCEGDREAFSCWIYRVRTPVLAAPQGWLTLPAGTVCLEDSVTQPDFRGQGIAPAAWSAIADALAAEDVLRIVTKVAVDNAPSRKAVTKAGFVEVALQRLTRVARRKQVTVDVYGGCGDELAARLR